MILHFPFPCYWLQCHPKHIFPYRLLTFKYFVWKGMEYIYILYMYETGFVHVHVSTSTQKFPTWENTMLEDLIKRWSLFLVPPGFSRSSVQKVWGHLKAFRFSIVFNWYVYDQEEDKLWKGKTLVLLLRPLLTSLPESTSTKYPGAKSRITYIPATLTGNYPIKAAIPPPPFPS